MPDINGYSIFGVIQWWGYSLSYGMLLIAITGFLGVTQHYAIKLVAHITCRGLRYGGYYASDSSYLSVRS